MAEIATDKKASDVLLLEIGRLTSIADYFVICSGGSERQIKAVTDEIEEKLKGEDGLSPVHVEGTPSSGWVLLDYGDVIVHVFATAEREFYRLERIWSDAPVVLHIL